MVVALRPRLEAPCIALALLIFTLHTAFAFNPELSSVGHRKSRVSGGGDQLNVLGEEDDEDSEDEDEVPSSYELSSIYNRMYSAENAEDEIGEHKIAEDEGRGMVDVFGEWLRSRQRIPTSKRSKAEWIANPDKRRPNCMMKCLSQGYLHPAQCHALC